MEQNERPELNSYVKSELIYDKGAKNIQRGKESLFSKDLGKIRQSYAKTVISTTTCHKQKLLKRIKDLNVKTKTNNSRCLHIRKRL